MPELPEVETIATDLRRELVGATFTEVEIHWPAIVATHSANEFSRNLCGQSVLDVGRRGKFLVLHLSGGGALLFHLRMTGQLLLRPGQNPRDPHDHVIFRLADGRELRYCDQRKFGRVYLVCDASEIVRELGPEPLAKDFTPEQFAAMLARRRGALKPLLLNQRFLAGLGNIYTDEALFVARLHPRRRANTLSPDEVHRLYDAIHLVLRSAIAGRGTTFDGSYRDAHGQEGHYQGELRVFGREQATCPRCGANIQRLMVGGRGTRICPQCQPE
ncbi:MAG: bifunctional DNA-formamidopyrimidine glycosylase/DNA-(apurinic or apyrimidinic site) lyase [Chloroflexi bacterium]|nr:bifunctional DNA-formamidopyrimidine glycosylase/DNA-(apurinic or apyrimidinic site) lyase [Chloroflexota bacterium]